MKRFCLFLLLVLSVGFFNVKDIYALESIEVKDISVAEVGGSAVANDFSYENNRITSHIEFNELNDFVTFNITVKNNTDIAFVLESIKKQY
jgi:hypothetical protein